MRVLGGGDLPLREFARRLYREYEDDLLFDTAAQLAYYFLLALFPFLFFLATLTAYLPLESVMKQLFSELRIVAPGPVAQMMEDHLGALTSEERPRLLAVSFLFTLWSASRGVDCVRRSLNLAYDVKESRRFWTTEITSLLTTIVGAAMIFVGVGLMVVSGSAGLWLADRFDIPHVYVGAAQQLRWPVTALMIAATAGVTYYALPDVKQRVKFIIPGSIVATATWLLSTWIFGRYIGGIGQTNVAYQSLGGVLIVLVWLYLTGFTFVLGGTINAILEHASLTGKERGARDERETPPPASERPSAIPPGAVDSATVAARAGGHDDDAP